MSLLDKNVSLKWVVIGLLLIAAVFFIVKQRQETALINRAIRQLDLNGQTLTRLLIYNIQQGRISPMPQQQSQPAAKEELKSVPKESEKKK